VSSIQTYLNNIINAVYGEEVRSSIKNAIQQCYSDVTSPQLNLQAFKAAVQSKIDDGTIQNMTIPNGTIGVEKLNFSAAVNLTAAQKAELIGLLDDTAPIPG